MRRVHYSELPVGEVLAFYVIGPDGTILHSPGDVLETGHLRSLKDLGRLTAIDDPQTLDSFIEKSNYEVLNIHEIEPGRILANVYDRRGNLLVPDGTAATEEMLKSFLRRGLLRLTARREVTPELRQKVAEYMKASEALVFGGINLRAEIDKTAGRFTGHVFGSEERTKLDVPPDQPVPPEESDALDRVVRREQLERKRSQAIRLRMLDAYKALIERVKTLLDKIAAAEGGDVPADIREVARQLIGSLITDRELLLATIYYQDDMPYLYQHPLNVAILSINVATALGYSLGQVIEISYGALLHDIGMRKVPQSILMKKGRLERNEWFEVMRHPVHTLDLLENVRGLPPSTPYIVYQCHERLTGRGYPRRARGLRIHNFARIVMVADAYDAMIHPRAWRPAFTPYRAVENLIKDGAQGEFDVAVVKAFLKSVGLYPIGSYVVLSNDTMGKVIAIHHEQYDRPLVRMMWDIAGKKEIDRTVNLAVAGDLRVVKAVASHKRIDNRLGGF